MSTLADVSILVTSFLRLGYLRDCLATIQSHLPECPVVIVDDSEESHVGMEISTSPKPFITKSTGLAPSSTWWMVRLPFDSGLSAKRNAGVRVVTTPYTLLAADDFDFSTPGCREGILDMLAVIDDDINTRWDLVGGRVNGAPYEGLLEYVPGSHIKETRLENLNGLDFVECDLTVNYFLARTKVLRQFPWPEEMKIGGEHVCLFLDLKLAGKKVAWVKGVNINTFPHETSKIDPRYPEFRARARTLGHPLMMKRYGIKEYIG